MAPEKIQSAIHGMITDAVTYLESELTPGRATATQYYLGSKFGNEETGRSQFVSTDLRDTVLAMLPSLVRMFVPTSGRVFEYQARPKTMQLIDAAVAAAEQATEFVNGVVMNVDNNGYLELHGTFKDGLVRKLGTIKYWWEDVSNYQNRTRNCDVNQYEALVNDPDVEIVKVSEKQDQASGLTYYDVDYKQWRKEGYARFSCVPPEEMLVSRDARTREDAGFFGHRTEKTASELLAMGVSQKDIDDYGGSSTEVRQSLEEIARRGGISHIDNAPEPSLVKNLWVEAYPYLDVDGDGVAELVKIRALGPGHHIVGDPEPVDERPFAFFCPDWEPHVLIGQGIDNRTMDIQLMKSSVIRAAADGLSLSIFPKEYLMEGVVDRQAAESTAIGQKVMVRDGVLPQQAVMVVNTEWHGQDALALLGYLDQVKQQRVGPLPATLDPDSLQSTPEVGVKATVQAASEQLELIARNFTVGMQQLGKGLLKLLVENQPRARITRLRGQWVPVDPKAWDADMDVSVNVALGTQEKLGVLAANAAKQEAVLQMLGPSNPMCSIPQLLHTYKTMLEIQGIPDTGKFWNDLPPDWKPPQQQPQPDPNMVLAMAEVKKAEAALAKQQADFQLGQVKAQQEMADLKAQLVSKKAELDLTRETAHLTDDRERDKVEADIALRAAELNAKYPTDMAIKELEAQLRREEMAVDLQKAKIGAKAKRQNGKPKEPASAG
jgi:hypothetical protein